MGMIPLPLLRSLLPIAGLMILAAPLLKSGSGLETPWVEWAVCIGFGVACVLIGAASIVMERTRAAGLCLASAGLCIVGAGMVMLTDDMLPLGMASLVLGAMTTAAGIGFVRRGD